MKHEIVDLFGYLADSAESYGTENLYLARHEEGYVGDPKEFRFSDVYRGGSHRISTSYSSITSPRP
jgi:hypothetical protein